VLTQQVLERRALDALRVAPLLWLVQLLWIAEQHHAVRRARRGDRVRQRHLPRLVHEQHVHRCGHVRTGPEPRRATDDVGFSGLEQAQRLLVARDRSDTRRHHTLVGGALLRDSDGCIRVIGRARHLAEQIRDHGVTVRHHTHLLPLRDQGADHPRADVCLSRARRSLNRQESLVQLTRDLDREVGRSTALWLRERAAGQLR